MQGGTKITGDLTFMKSAGSDIHVSGITLPLTVYEKKIPFGKTQWDYLKGQWGTCIDHDQYHSSRVQAFPE